MSEATTTKGRRTLTVLDGSRSEAVDQAVVTLRSGGLISFPTDTVYALAAALDQPLALEALYSAKGRSLAKAIPVLLASPAELSIVAAPLSSRIRRFVGSLWPGPVTVVLQARGDLPDAVTVPSQDGSNTVAVRVPDHRLARDLIKRSGGAVAATSANLSGQPPATTAAAAVAQLGSWLQAVVDGGPAPGGVASTIITITPAGPEIVRQGDLAVTDLAQRWEASAHDHP